MKLRDAKVGDWVKVDGRHLQVVSRLHSALVTVEDESGRQQRLSGNLEAHPAVEARSIKIGAITYPVLRRNGVDAFACTGRSVGAETQPARHTTLDANGRSVQSRFLEPYTGTIAPGTCYTYGAGSTSHVTVKEEQVIGVYVFYAPAGVTGSPQRPFDFLGNLKPVSSREETYEALVQGAPPAPAPKRVTVNVDDLERGDTYVCNAGVYRKTGGGDQFIRDTYADEPRYPSVRRTTAADVKKGDRVKWCDAEAVAEADGRVPYFGGYLPPQRTVTILPPAENSALTFGDVVMIDGDEYVFGCKKAWLLGSKATLPRHVPPGTKAIRKQAPVKPEETVAGQSLVSRGGIRWFVTAPGQVKGFGTPAQPVTPGDFLLVYDGRPAVKVGDKIKLEGHEYVVAQVTYPGDKAHRVTRNGRSVTLAHTDAYEVVK